MRATHRGKARSIKSTGLQRSELLAASCWAEVPSKEELTSIIGATLHVIIKRAWYRRMVLLPTALGALGAMTLLASVPLFANRGTDIALQQNLHAPGSLVSRNLEIIYPSRAMTTNIYDQTNDYVSTSIVQTLGSALVPSAPLRGGETGSLVLSLSGEAHTPQQPLGSTVLWFSSSMNSTHLRLLQGRFPSSHLLGITSTPRGVAYDIEAIVAPEWAAQFHLKLNAVVEVADADALDLHLNFKPFLRVHIVGFFQPKSLQDPAWFDDLDPFTPPSGFNDALPPMPIWVNQTTFTERIPLIFPNAHAMRNEM